MLTCVEWWWQVIYGEDECLAFGLSNMAAFGELEQFQWRGREECLNGVRMGGEKMETEWLSVFCSK